MDKWYEDPVYIKMCEKAGEIENIIVDRMKSDGGWLRTSAVGSMVNAIAYNGEVFTFLNHDYIDTWLPHQAQLQAMVGGDNYILVKRFSEWALSSDRCQNRDWIMTSMEQLWLAFVMKEKYNKVWNGTEWRNDGS